MKNYDILKKQIEEILEKLNIKYNFLSYGDDDLNYQIEVETIGILKPLNSITCILYLTEKDMSINLIMGNIYRINNKKINLLDLYKIVNKINACVKNGNFLIDEDLNQIFFKSSINCGNNFYNLNDNLINYLIKTSINALEKLLVSLKDIEDEKK